MLGTKLISDQINRRELSVILRELRAVLDAKVVGDVVEFGCYVGTASLFLQQSLIEHNKILHVYDSFQGLPPKTAQDASPVGEQFKSGELQATKAQLIKNFRRANLPLPTIHKAWFDDLKPSDLPQQICFAFLDGDFYHSILTSLQLVWPRLQSGAVVVVDDYQTEALPGVKKAIKEWARNQSFTIKHEATIAILKPLRL